jgi:hypothetical protein
MVSGCGNELGGSFLVAWGSTYFGNPVGSVRRSQEHKEGVHGDALNVDSRVGVARFERTVAVVEVHIEAGTGEQSVVLKRLGPAGVGLHDDYRHAHGPG